MLPAIGRIRAALLLMLAGAALGCSRRAAPKAAGGPSPRRAVPAAQGRCLFADETSKYTVVFAAPGARVKAIFTGWRPPGPAQMKFVRNFFTGKDEPVKSTEPADTEPGPAAQEWDLRADDIAPDAGYAGYLESRIPPEIRALPHRAMKRIIFELMMIAKALTGDDELPEALYPPSGCTTSLPLLRVPDAAVAALRALSEGGATNFARRLAKDGDAFRDWDVADIRAFLVDLRALSAASAGANLYVLPV
jgi:hypothetical protein